MNFRSIILTILILSQAFSQMPAVGTFYYELNPREALFGQRVAFAAREFNMCLYSYDVTYELLPTPISSKKTTIINMLAKRRPQCATAVGYSGPMISFDSLKVGAYVLQFDSLSDFKRDLGDTNTFEVVLSSMGVSKNGIGKQKEYKRSRLGKRRLDGKEVHGQSPYIQFEKLKK